MALGIFVIMYIYAVVRTGVIPGIYSSDSGNTTPPIHPTTPPSQFGNGCEGCDALLREVTASYAAFNQQWEEARSKEFKYFDLRWQRLELRHDEMRQ